MDRNWLEMQSEVCGRLPRRRAAYSTASQNVHLGTDWSARICLSTTTAFHANMGHTVSTDRMQTRQIENACPAMQKLNAQEETLL